MKPNPIALVLVGALCLVPVTALAVDRLGTARLVDVQQAVPDSLTGGATAPRWQLVGFSTQATNGQAGILRMTALCQANFPGSRMCTYEEIAGTTSIPPLPPVVNAWAQPIPVDLLAAGVGAESCLTGSNAEGTNFGLLVSEFGVTSRGGCNGNHSVACCGPM